MPLDANERMVGWFYRDCFTIDPKRGMRAWEKLSSNELGLEIGMLPKILHFALLDTLRERKTLEKAAIEQVKQRRQTPNWGNSGPGTFFASGASW